MLLIFHSVPFPITKTVELFVALLENFKISSESKTPVIFILTATYTTRPTFIDILLIMDTLFGTVTPKRELLFYTLISSNASSIPSGVINVTCRLRSLKSIVILLLITLHISPYKFVYDEG